jgi:hypothetical protein
MPVSETMICNMALGRIGISQQISNIDGNHSVERTCKLYYDISREYVLGDKTWPFAQRYVALALVEENPNEEWQFAYRYPADTLRLDHIVVGGLDTTGTYLYPYTDYTKPHYTKADSTTIPYELGSDASGKLIYTDITDAKAKYTADITDTDLFDAHFVNCLAWRLATELAGVLTRDPAIRASADQQYMLTISSAHANTLNETNNTIYKESSFITAGY